MSSRTALDAYRRKRDFAQTPEPRHGRLAGASGIFVVQKHRARQLHYDFRLELDGTLKSWAVPKGPSLDPAVKRMAVEVEDHPVSYAAFEGEIPPGQYGAGSVEVWDRGRWKPEGDPRAGLAAGRLVFELEGEKLHGQWALIRMRQPAGERPPSWLLIKERDAAARDQVDYDVLVEAPDSVLKPGRTGAAAAPPLRRATRAPVAPGAKGKGDPVSHPDRVIDPASGATKGELADYVERVAPLMLPHLRQRPVALVRAPAGVGKAQFFQKHADAGEIPGATRLDPSLDPGNEPLLVLGTARALHSAAQLNVIEIHTWNMTVRTMPRPDRVVFDLDPGEGVAWPAVREAAVLLRDVLAELGLAVLVKTSGGKGLHLVVPIAPRLGWQVVRAVAQAVVGRLVEMAPDRFAAKSGPRNRVGKIFIDYLRNGWGATTAAAWSPRARPGLGISVPFAWSELPAVTGGAHWHLRNIDERASVGNGPWSDAATRQTLTRAMKALKFTSPPA